MISINDLSERAYGEVAIDTIELAEHFLLHLMPAIWSRDTTIQQAQISGLILIRQLRGEQLTVSEIASELGMPRTSVQHSVDRLIDLGRVEAREHDSDGRKRILFIPMKHSHDVGEIETLVIDFRLHFHFRLREILSKSTKPGTESDIDHDAVDLADAVERIEQAIQLFRKP